MDDIEFSHKDESRVIVKKISFNIGVFSSIFGDNVLDLLAIEGLELIYENDIASNMKERKSEISY